MDNLTPDTLLNHSAEALAQRIAQEPALMERLVAAQKRRPTAAAVSLLEDAIGRASHRLDGRAHGVAVCLALAELALLLGDDDRARRMAHLGLRQQPYNAALVLVLARVPDDPHVGEPATVVLRRIARHDDSPQLRAALSLRAAA